MVYIKALKEELQDIEMYDLENTEIAIGVTAVAVDYNYQLFDKSDVIINKIEKLPVLRGIEVEIYIVPSVVDRLIASGGEALSVEINVWNGDAADENLLFAKQLHYSNVSSGAAIKETPSSAQRKICYLLTDTLILEGVFSLDDVCAGAAFVANNVVCKFMLDIDWVKVTSEELKEYAIEQLYVNM